MTGGNGDDVFRISLKGGTDTITDFTEGKDTITFETPVINGISQSFNGSDTEIFHGDTLVAIVEGVDLT